MYDIIIIGAGPAGLTSAIYASRSNNNTRTTKYNAKNNKKDKDVDDNLFDLIDSMYNKED